MARPDRNYQGIDHQIDVFSEKVLGRVRHEIRVYSKAGIFLAHRRRLEALRFLERLEEAIDCTTEELEPQVIDLVCESEVDIKIGLAA